MDLVARRVVEDKEAIGVGEILRQAGAAGTARDAVEETAGSNALGLPTTAYSDAASSGTNSPTSITGQR